MALTKLPRGTQAGVGTSTGLAAASTSGPTGKVPSGNTPKSSTGKTIKPAGSQRMSSVSVKVTRAPEGQTNGVIPRKSAPGGMSKQGDNGNRKPTEKSFGKDKHDGGGKVGGRKVAGPIASGGNGFGQGSGLLGGVSNS
jgi:hypothetical protein